MTTRTENEPRPLPSEFMRQRRPELFSDTKGEAIQRVDRSTLEWWLGSLTARNQQHDFEVFCRRLAERELCPNWRPLTGPTGGGDSKADSSTYPVSPEIGERWYEATPPPTKERWALAISAKADWRAKVRSDVAGLAQTANPPSHVFFLTNQYAKDKARADLETELSRKHGMVVTILDLSSIVARVCDHRNDDLAIECLHVTATISASPLGPNDVRRTEDVLSIEDRLKNSTPEMHPTRVHLMDDFLRLAELEAQLGKPRHGVEQRLARAQQIADDIGAPANTRRVLYQRAWILHWWYNDIGEADRALDQWLEHLKEIDDAWELQQVSNLWHLRLGNASDHAAKSLRIAHGRILECAGRLADDQARPNAALHAKIIRDTLRLQAALLSGDDTADILDGLTAAFADSQGLVLVPVVALSEPLMEIDNTGAFDDNPRYEALFEVLAGLQQDRAGELKSGRAFYRRGARLLHEEKFQKALAPLGRARVLLAKHESADDLVAVMFAIGVAYEMLDCPWAAHVEYTHALAFELQAAGARQEPPSASAISLLLRLAGLEVLAGRPCWLFMWIETLRTVSAILGVGKRINEDVGHVDSELGALFLRADLPALTASAELVSALDTLGLWGSRLVLLYALGYSAEAREEGLLADLDIDKVPGVLHRFAFSDDAARLPNMTLTTSPREKLATTILGSSVTVTFPNSSAGTALAQGVLALLDSVFVTLAKRQGVLTAAAISIDIDESGDASEAVDVHVVEAEVATMEVNLGAQFFRDGGLKVTPEAIGRLRLDLLDVFITRFSIMSTAAFQEMLESDAVGERAFAVGLPTASLDWLGSHRGRFEQWSSADDRHPLLRTKEWWRDEGRHLAPAVSNKEVLVDIIDIRRWRDAVYRGVAFLVPDYPAGIPTGRETPPLPAMGFLFEKAEPAKLLFAGWRSAFGQEDVENAIDVTIVEDIDADGSYGVLVSPGTEYLRRLGHQNVLAHSTCQLCRPTSGIYPRFKAEYVRRRVFLLRPFVLRSAGLAPVGTEALLKRHLTIVRYSDLAPGDSRREILANGGRAPVPRTAPDPDREAAKKDAYAIRLAAERARRKERRGGKRPKKRT